MGVPINVPRDIMTEAKRLAIEALKAGIREAGIKPSHVEMKEITAAANALVTSDYIYLAKAQRNLNPKFAETQAVDRLLAKSAKTE